MPQKREGHFLEMYFADDECPQRIIPALQEWAKASGFVKIEPERFSTTVIISTLGKVSLCEWEDVKKKIEEIIQNNKRRRTQWK